LVIAHVCWNFVRVFLTNLLSKWFDYGNERFTKIERKVPIKLGFFTLLNVIKILLME